MILGKGKLHCNSHHQCHFKNLNSTVKLSLSIEILIQSRKIRRILKVINRTMTSRIHTIKSKMGQIIKNNNGRDPLCIKIENLILLYLI